MDQPEKVLCLAQACAEVEYAKGLFLDIYNWLAWTVPPQSLLTSDKYSFLKNSIDGNEKLAINFWIHNW